MKRESSGEFLSAVFVDYDNIYLSLKRKNEDAAKRFAKDALFWLKEIENGRLITPTSSLVSVPQRRIIMNRCYGNPVPRRNTHDNSTDMNSFPFVRHHYLRAGFEIIDCPPLTAQLKNSSDIRMVMDVRDFLTHDTYFDEFIILSGDADFTPLLHRLRAHARRTVIFANDYTAAPYTAISDGEVREADLIALLVEGKPRAIEAPETVPATGVATAIEECRRAILGEVTTIVRTASAPVPLETLADRTLRVLGPERTTATAWAGAGSFRNFLAQNLPEDIRLTDQPPFLAYDTRRQIAQEPPPVELRQVVASPAPAPAPVPVPAAMAAVIPPLVQTAPPVREAPAQLERAQRIEPIPAVLQPLPPLPSAPPPRSAAYGDAARAPFAPPAPPVSRAVAPPSAQVPAVPPAPLPPAQPPQQRPAAARPNYQDPPPVRAPAPQAAAPQAAAPTTDQAAALQRSIARVHEASQAPPLAPAEYRALFDVMALELNENHLQGAQTISNIVRRAQDRGLDIRRDDVRFVLEVVSEADPWFEQGASANLFAGRFRNFVVARCRGQGLNLSADELDLVDAWFAGSGQAPVPRAAQPQASPAAAAARAASAPVPPTGERYWPVGEERAAAAVPRAHFGTQNAPPDATGGGDEFPRIVRSRMRG